VVLNSVTWFFYDTNHRLLRIESPQGAVKTGFSYDSATSGVGKMATASNDGHTWRYSYDVMGRVTNQTLSGIPRLALREGAIVVHPIKLDSEGLGL